MTEDATRAWAESVTIPTYRAGNPEKNPMFLEKRVYQGSSGAIYPYALIERVEQQKTEVEYTAVFLENRYLKVMILPELGGRVQMAQDKTNGYHFIYYNRVIKPALVGLAGPWISGGIEFNWPQHHRPSTFSPLDWRIDQNPDGSKTVWCSEIERMSGCKGMHGFTLYPDLAVLEVRVQLYNRTSLPQSFLWWANPAVHANENTQSIFPTDVHAVLDHGKRNVSSYPIARGIYYKVNYAPGTDISRYKNIPVPTSFMAYSSEFDFIGNYDYGAQAGMLHVADHHLVPGKKQWTWGCGEFGQAWDRQLTDEDGPYIELMCGAFTDNQPDFSWIMPGEEKTFTQVFFPFKRIGPPKNASREAAVNLEVYGQTAIIGVYVTRTREVRVELRWGGELVYHREASLSPGTPLLEKVDIDGLTGTEELTLRVLDGKSELVSFSRLPEEKIALPSPALPAKPPQEISTSEELYLNGLHLEQYRHATYQPEQYYQEAIRRDPLDSRCNNALGLLLYRRGKFAEAEPYFRKAIESLTRRNSNPYDGEPYYNLGLCLKMLGRYAESYNALYKSVWNAAWQDAGFFKLAQISCRAGQYEQALEQVGQALRRNWSHHKARHLKIALLRRLGRKAEALRESNLALELDRMEYGTLWERRLLAGDDSFEHLAGDRLNTGIEIALDYAHAGLYDEAIELLNSLPGKNPMERYFLGWVYSMAGKQRAAIQAFREGAELSPDGCFPNQLESVMALEEAMYLNPLDPRAPYYLGNFWYAHRRYSEAINCWEASRCLDPSFPTLHRNLSLAYYNQLHDPGRALVSLEIAFALDPADGRVFYELDQLEKRLNRPPLERLESLEVHAALVKERDDLAIEQVMLLNLLGRYDEALELLLSRNFHPWEGGEGKTTGQYVLALVEKARLLIQEKCYQGAIEALERARVYPSNLGEGKLYDAPENNIYYYLGLAWEGLEDDEKAGGCFEKASSGTGEVAAPRYYNDQPPEMVYYQGLALRKLGRDEQARGIFQKLVDYGQTHLNDRVSFDYFAVSLPDFLVFDEDLSRRNRIHCHFLMALGYSGFGDLRQSESQLRQVLALDANHSGAHIFRRIIG